MLTREGLRQLRDALRRRHVLSVYLDGRVSDPAKRRVWRAWLTSALTAARHGAEGSVGEAAVFDACCNHLEARLQPIAGALGAQGFVAFISEEGVALAEDLPVPIPNMVQWSVGPWVSPYIHAQKELRPALLAIVGTNAIRIYRYALGSLVPLERLHAHTRIDEAAHMGSMPRPTFHTGTRGETAKDAAQRARNAGTRRMIHELNDRLAHHASSDEWILIGGTHGSAALAMTLLAEGLQQRATIVSRLNLTTPTSMLRRTAATAARKLRRVADDLIVQRSIEDSARHGLGAVGESSTQTALGLDAVQQLLFTSRYMSEHPQACERMTRRALDEGATIEHVAGAAEDHLDQVGGVAAVLRFAVARPDEPVSDRELTESFSPVATPVDYSTSVLEPRSR